MGTGASAPRSLNRRILMADFDRMCGALEKGETDALKALVQAALDEGVPAVAGMPRPVVPAPAG